MVRTSPINLLPRKDPAHLVRIAIGACLGVSAVMVWAIMWGTTEPQSATISSGSDGTPETSISSTPESVRRPQALGDTPATSLVLGAASDTVSYYERKTGKAFTVNLRLSKSETLSGASLPGFLGTVWSPSGHEVVSTFDIAGKRVPKYFDYTSGKSAVVGIAATTVAFSPDGKRLAYVDTIDGDSAIYVGSSDGSDARKILAIRATEPKLSWPRDDVLFFESRRPDGNISDLTALTLDGKISVLLSHKTNLEYVWSRDGKKLLFSYFSNHGIELWYMDTGTGVPLPLSLSTSAQKCAWRPDSTSIVCGVPPSESLTRDTASGRTSTLDDIVTLSLLTGDTQKMYSAQKGSFLGVTEPLVSSSGNFLVFINSFDQRPYRFALP